MTLGELQTPEVHNDDAPCRPQEGAVRLVYYTTV